MEERLRRTSKDRRTVVSGRVIAFSLQPIGAAQRDYEGIEAWALGQDLESRLCYKGISMNEIEKRFRNRIVLIVSGGGIALLLLAWGLVKGVLQGRTVAIAGAVLWIAMSVAILSLLRMYRRTDAEFRTTLVAGGVDIAALDRDRAIKNVRALKRGIIFMALLLPYGLWQTRGVPFLPRAAGMSANLMTIGVLALSLVRAKKKLKNPD